MESYCIWQRKSDGYFEGKISVNGRQISRYGLTRNSVEKKLKKIEREAEKGTAIGIRLRLDKAVERYLTTVKRSRVKPSTYDRQECTLKNQITDTSIGRRQLSSVKSEDIQSYLSDLTQRYSISTVKKVYNLLGEFFKYAVATRQLTYNPMSLVEMPHQTQFVKQPKSMAVLTVDEMNNVIAVAEGVKKNGLPSCRYGEAIVLLLLTGLRSGELRALKIQDIDFEKRMLYVNRNICHHRDKVEGGFVDSLSSPKTKKSIRVIPLGDRAILAAKRLYATTYSSKNDLLISTESGKILSGQSLENTYSSILKKAGLQHMGLHSTRHTFATIVLKEAEEKGQIKEVSELLGHSQVSTTYEYYIKADYNDKRSLISSLDKMIK